MLYLSAISISFALYWLNISFLPHFWPYFSVPVLFLTFLSIYALRDKTIFPYILSFIFGLIYDGASIGLFPKFTVIFLTVTVVGKLIFVNLTNYGLERTSYLLYLIGTILLWLSTYDILVVNLNRFATYASQGVNLALGLFVIFLSYRFGEKYFDYVEKTTSERFR